MLLEVFLCGGGVLILLLLLLLLLLGSYSCVHCFRSLSYNQVSDILALGAALAINNTLTTLK